VIGAPKRLEKPPIWLVVGSGMERLANERGRTRHSPKKTLGGGKYITYLEGARKAEAERSTMEDHETLEQRTLDNQRKSR